MPRDASVDVAEVLDAGKVVAADDDVVEEVDAQQLAGPLEFARGPDVLWAGGGIARRVVVRHDEVGQAIHDGGPQHLGGADGAFADRALVDDALPREVVPLVEQQDAELFLRQVRHLVTQQRVHVMRDWRW